MRAKKKKGEKESVLERRSWMDLMSRKYSFESYIYNVRVHEYEFYS